LARLSSSPLVSCVRYGRASRGWLWAGFLGFALLLGACGGGDDGVTSFASDDGVVSVDVPPGAAPDDFKGSVSQSDASALGIDVSDVDGVLLVYELGPDGTEFGEPVTVTFRISSVLGGFDPEMGLPLSLVVIEDADGGYEPLGSMRSFLDGDVLVVEGTTTHFSTAVVELPGGSILLHPQGGFRQYVVDLRFEVRVLEVRGGVHTIEGVFVLEEIDFSSLFTVGRIDWSSEDPIDIVRIDPDRNQAVMKCTARGEDITIKAVVFGATSVIGQPAGWWIVAHLLTGGSAEFLGNLSLEIDCIGGVSSTSSTSSTTSSTIPPTTSSTTPPTTSSTTPSTTSSTIPSTTTTAVSGGSKGFSANVNCPLAGNTSTAWFDINIPEDASSPGHSFGDPLDCPNTPVGITARVIDAGAADPTGLPTPSPPAGSKTYRIVFSIGPAGDGATGGSDAVSVTVSWS